MTWIAEVMEHGFLTDSIKWMPVGPRLACWIQGTLTRVGNEE